MPFRHVPPGQFDLDTMKQMQSAFDAVCERLSMSPDDQRRFKLATIIIELDGEREALGNKAELALKQETQGRKFRKAEAKTTGSNESDDSRSTIIEPRVMRP